MVSQYKYRNLTWIDLESPTKQEVLSLIEDYEIPELVGEELLRETIRSKVDVYDNLIYLVLRFPSYKKNDDPESEQEIDFIIGQDFLITAHYDLVDPLHDFSKVFEVNSVLKKDSMGDHAGYLFFFIMRELYKHTLDRLDGINNRIKEAGKHIFEGQESEMVESLSSINRKLLNFKQSLRFHEETLRSFEIAGITFFGPEFQYHLSTIQGEYKKVKDTLEAHKEILNDLRDTNDSLLSTKTNETIKTLTIMTFIMLPITLIASIFGMNTLFPLIISVQDFLFILGAMILTGLIMFVYFKGRKWL